MGSALLTSKCSLSSLTATYFLQGGILSGFLTSLIDKQTPFPGFFDFSFELSFLRKQFL
jgi:hypothetical protein